MNYKTCEEYVLACLDTTKNELNKIKADNALYKQGVEKQIALDKELIAQRNEDIKYLVELLNSFDLTAIKSYNPANMETYLDIHSTTGIRLNNNIELMKYIDKNATRLGLKVKTSKGE